jgi:hypothetical protein
MSTPKIIAIAVASVALLILAAALFVWPQMHQRGLVVREDGSAARSNVQHESEARDTIAPRNSPATNRSSVISGSPRPADTPSTRIDASRLEEGEVLVRAQVTLTSPHGLDIFRMAEREPWTLCVRFTASPEYSNDNYFGGDASGLIETRYSLDELPIEDGKLQTGTWSARICWEATEAFVPMAVPKFEGRVLDFGKLEFDLGAALDPTEWLVIGRLVHTTGIPVSGFDDLSLRFGGTDSEQYWLGVRSDGCFAMSVNDFNKDAPAWLQIGDGEDDIQRQLGKPKITGRFVDYGDITLDCAIVEFHLAGWPESGLRRQRHGIAADAELEPMALWISISNYSSSRDIELQEPDGTILTFLMPGPYRWYAFQSDQALAFSQLKGEVNLVAGKVLRVELSLDPAPCVLARFKAARPLEQLTLEVSTVTEPGVYAELSTDGVSDPTSVFAIANPGRLPLHIVARARGYQPVTLDTAAGASECLFEFTQIVDPQSGRLVVLLPKLPDALKDLNFTFTISLARTSNGVTNWRDLERIGRNESRWGEEDPDKVRSYDVENGVIRVVLRERDPGMGYPGGIVCGAIEATIESDKLTVVQLPELPAPPWAIFSNQTRARLTCDNLPMSYHGPVCVGENTQVMSLYHDQNLAMPLDDYAIMDGNTRVALQLALPDSETRTAVYYHDFPARIEVRVKRGKEIIPVQVSARISSPDGTVQVSSSSSERGLLRMWSPAGKAMLEVDVTGWPGLNREIEVGTELKVVEFELAGTFVNLDWDERYFSEQGMAWLLRDANGVTLSSVAIRQSSLRVEQGHYTLIPQMTAKPEVTFDLGASTDITVQIPFVAALDCSGSMMVRFPKELKPDPDGYSVDWRWFVTVTGNAERDLEMREYIDDSSWNRVSGEGIKFMGMPVDVEFTLVVSVASLDDDDNVSATGWAIAPLRVKLKGGSTETIAVDWKRAAVLTEEWFEGVSLKWSGSAAQGMIYADYWRVLLPGTYVLIYEGVDGQKSLEVAIKLEDDKQFAMPKDVRQALYGEPEPDEGGSGGD